ncbi:MAG: protein translocase subunit SecF [Patescibacteria group bacterium]|nr:protein translocase subunit SecF [Patescibacteria group bacterium]
MLDVVGKKWIYFFLSAILIIPGIFSLASWGLNAGIDFTGGTLLELKLEKASSGVNISSDMTAKENQQIRDAVKKDGLEVSIIQRSGDQVYTLRTRPLETAQSDKLKKSLEEKFGKVEQLRLETVGPTIGGELLRNAILSIVFASIMIVIYIAFAFREVPKPASSWRFGICAILALIHDVLVVVGVFSLLGHFYKVEVDSLFVTALLTVIGFSVHDTIVVFDRIRENLKRRVYSTFAETVNHSILQTIGRSLNTSLTVVFVLVALILFGGTTIRWFVVALLVGILSGTYSSIFNASPLLVLWQEWQDRKELKIAK